MDFLYGYTGTVVNETFGLVREGAGMPIYLYLDGKCNIEPAGKAGSSHNVPAKNLREVMNMMEGLTGEPKLETSKYFVYKIAIAGVSGFEFGDVLEIGIREHPHNPGKIRFCAELKRSNSDKASHDIKRVRFVDADKVVFSREHLRWQAYSICEWFATLAAGIEIPDDVLGIRSESASSWPLV